jgi:type IV pilus assembly protein PilM
MDSFISKQAIGLELKNSVLTCALLSQVGNKTHIEALIEESFEERVKPLYNEDCSTCICTALPAKDILVRSLHLPLRSKSDIDAVLPFQADPLLPYSSEEAIFSKNILRQEGDNSQIVLIATHQNRIATHLEDYKSQGVEPEEVSCLPTAIALFTDHFVPSASTIASLYIDENESCLIFSIEGKLLVSHPIPMGLSQFEEAAEADSAGTSLDSIDLSTLKSSSFPELNKCLKRFIQEVTRALFAGNKQVHKLEFDSATELLITGSGSQNSSLNKTLYEALMISQSSLQIDKKTLTPESSLHHYAASIGLALASLKQDVDVNFRQKAFAYPKPLKRYKRPLLAYTCLMFLLCFFSFLFFNQKLSEQEISLKKDYSQIVSLSGRSVLELEQEYRKRERLPDVNQNSFSLSMLNSESIYQRLNFLEKQLKEQPTSFPLQPNIARVSDFIAWLEKHPTVVDKDNTLLNIENLSYTMVKRPMHGKVKDHYVVKVEIEFTAETPKLAREFHDALITANEMIDPKAEVKWNTSQGKYKASFFLKDKTVYPS